MTDENGLVPDSNDDSLISEIETRMNSEKEIELELKSQLEGIVDRRRRYERALAALTGTKLSVPKPSSKSQSMRTRTVPIEVIDQVREYILGLDRDEFRQIDVRTDLDISSGQVSIAFEQLRQENMIRFARREGLSKWFRLTEEAINARK